jgi:HSP20 family protein
MLGGESMSLARWEPIPELRRMREDMDRIFEDFWKAPMLSMRMPEVVAPAVDVYEKDNNVVVKAELPGLTKDDIEVIATEDSVSLKGEFRKEEEIEEEGFVRRERRFGRFYRTIPMPAAINADMVKASFKDGILEITAPRAEGAKEKERKVAIEA